MGTAEYEDAPLVVGSGDCRDIVCTRVIRFERLPGGLVRFVFGMEEQDERGNMFVREVDRQVWPIALIPMAIRVGQSAVSDQPLTADDGTEIRLTH